MKSLLTAVFGWVLLPAACLAQTFEVISIKPDPLPAMTLTFRFNQGTPAPHSSGNRYIERKITVQDLMMQAYGFRDYQVLGLPDWAKAPRGEHFYIEAKAEGDGTPSPDQLRVMLRALLTDRFQLKAHLETRDLPVYSLSVSKSGAKMRELTADETIPRPTRVLQDTATDKGTVEEMVRRIGSLADRPVFDDTGMTGRYEYASMGFLQIAEERRTDPLAAQNMLVDAVKVIGLKLEPQKRKTDVVVVEGVQMPATN